MYRQGNSCVKSAQYHTTELLLLTSINKTESEKLAQRYLMDQYHKLHKMAMRLFSTAADDILNETQYAPIIDASPASMAYLF